MTAPFTYGSVCSGIEAATMAWHPLGWYPSFFAEIDPFPRAVLSTHYPDVPLHDDFTTIQEGTYDPIDLLVGGTPCQSFSIAGLRGGLGDGRGNLALEYLRLADRLRPDWLVWENVPGVLSSKGGRDFGAILGGMVELGYGFAYRVLDAQYIRTLPFPWAVPQRRRRVFVVGYLGDWRRAAAVLFDRASLYGDPPPRRQAGQIAAPTLSARPTAGGGLGTDFDLDGGLQISHSLRGEGFDASEDGTGRGTPIVPVANSGEVSMCLTASAQQSLDAETETLIAFDCKGTGVQVEVDGSVQTLRSMSHSNSHQNAGGQIAVAYDMRGRDSGSQLEGPHDPASLRASSGGSSRSYAADRWAVRRLTPRECERLQGFPDDFTNVPWRGKNGSPDGRRYKALGNSMAVNVMRWIGDRIEMVNRLF